MDIMVIIFKFKMNIIWEKDICLLCASTPSPFSVTHQRHQLQHRWPHCHRISGKPKDHHLMVLIHQDQAPHHSLQHLCGHLHCSEEEHPHFVQPSVGIINYRIVNQMFHHISGTPQHPHQAREDLLQHLEHLHHRGQHHKGMKINNIKHHQQAEERIYSLRTRSSLEWSSKKRKSTSRHR